MVGNVARAVRDGRGGCEEDAEFWSWQPAGATWRGLCMVVVGWSEGLKGCGGGDKNTGSGANGNTTDREKK